MRTPRLCCGRRRDTVALILLYLGLGPWTRGSSSGSDLCARGEREQLRDPLRPLADRMRPRSLVSLSDSSTAGAGKPLRHAIESGQLHSLILWGPPGTGKTTLARLIAQTRGCSNSLRFGRDGRREGHPRGR